MSPAGEVHASAGSAGFTLLEVLVVIAVLALISGLAFPRVDRAIGNVQYASARSILQAAVQAARAEAVRTDSRIALTASDDGHGLLGNGRIIASLPSSVRVEAGENVPLFFGDGSSTGGTLTISTRRMRSELLIADGTGIAQWRQ
jgi:prepilin-type N-terminal cleavage/methylation domain-containing protein